MRNITLLLVDDHLNFLNAAIREFRKFPWIQVVDTAADGVEAVSKCDARFDAVLMDLNMPGMGGLQATRLIKAQDTIPFIVITSHFDDPDHREHARRAGADAFVSKLTYVTDVIPLLEQLRTAGGQAISEQA